MKEFKMINLIVMLLILLVGSALAFFSGLFIEEVYKLNVGTEAGSVIGLMVGLTIFISSLYIANHFYDNKNRG